MRLIDADRVIAEAQKERVHYQSQKNMAVVNHWIVSGIRKVMRIIEESPTVDPVKHKDLTDESEMIDCLMQISKQYGNEYMTMFGCTTRIKDYVNHLIKRIEEVNE